MQKMYDKKAPYKKIPKSTSSFLLTRYCQLGLLIFRSNCLQCFTLPVYPPSLFDTGVKYRSPGAIVRPP